MNTLKLNKFFLKNYTLSSKNSVIKNIRAYGSSNLVNVQVNSKTGIATVLMSRPPVNSLNLELVSELTNTMVQIEKDKGKGMIISSSSPGIFSAGIDIMELYQPNPDRVKAYWTALQDLWLHLYSSAYPTAAAITGHSPGAGCLIACSCDYRVMVQGKSSIGLNETQLGLVVPSWFIDTFRNIVSKRQSELALISGKLFTADEALKINLVDEVVEDNNAAIERANAYISQLSSYSLHAMSQTKLSLRYDAIKRLQDNREHDLRVFTKFVTSPEIQKGLQVYLENIKKKKQT
ncbi:3,2-trans-enoyl-CoA isomerase, putative [Pediculus humanus corporis]|uniref:Enoyl-CoA delta isomerase 1, mitochondrial n=1 Tax=Pediculus humanus subsp. corporis TaxID=121224 RepID=E0VVX4_PEDHC|nr:3,2-trans-enoyl-CoA isomerase, putative [Pediculus humanus corporis]EEB17530.1 3,2-trans-enoyl-CoA isomerase, putative [Pediculus humanus corporis]